MAMLAAKGRTAEHDSLSPASAGEADLAVLAASSGAATGEAARAAAPRIAGGKAELPCGRFERRADEPGVSVNAGRIVGTGPGAEASGQTGRGILLGHAAVCWLVARFVDAVAVAAAA